MLKASEKIITVPVEALNPYYKDINSYTDLPILLREQIQHFFHHYKDLEVGKWVKIIRWVGPDEAAGLIMAALDRARI